MPIKIPDRLPAAKILEQENIFVMKEERAAHQDIRPLKILILNLMPTKIETETQLLRLLSNSPLQVDVELLQTATYTSKNTSSKHLITFYKVFEEVRESRYDGMIITGAPVEQMEFEQVEYWDELCEIMEWSKTHVFSTMYICWGAQAGLHYHYGIGKYALPEKMFGVFSHDVLEEHHPLLRGFDTPFFAPHSRHTGICKEEIVSHPELLLLTCSDKAGVHIVASKDGRQVFITGHLEYDRDTLAKEYFRDVDKGLSIRPPEHYFQDDDPCKTPRFIWRAHANLFFSNWLNYDIYQKTPFDLSTLLTME